MLAATANSVLGMGLGVERRSNARPTNLREDQRGAIMMTGLFMAFFLVGALWYVIGIGDAVVFRNRMQEAADHSAFTAAALNAKGMNFISACNIVMLLLVAVHILLGIIHDFALAACILSLGTGCGGWVSARRIYTGYEKFFKPALSVIHYLEMGAGYGYPWLGAVKGYSIGSNYGNQGKTGAVTTVPLSTSMIPGPVYGSNKLGLPVSPNHFDYLCAKVGYMIFDWAKAHIPLPGLGFVGGIVNSILGGETVEDIVKSIIGAGIKLRYCNDLEGGAFKDSANGKALYKQEARGEKKIQDQNADTAQKNKNLKAGEKPGAMIDDPQIRKGTSSINGVGGQSWDSVLDPGFDRGWGQDGPYVTANGTSNGTDQFFVWSINISPKYKDTSTKRVNVPGNYKNVLGDSNEGAALYVAEAEFYYDCEHDWNADDCNGGNFDNDASFAIKWRARLRHVELPNLGALVAQFGLDFLTNTDTYKSIRDRISAGGGAKGKGGSGDASIFDGIAKGPLGSVGVGAIKDEIDNLLSTVEGKAYDKAGGVLGTPTNIGSLH